MRSVEYRFERRRPRSTLWASLGASVIFLVGGAGLGSVSLVIAAAVLPLPFLIWSILLDPRSGVELAAGRLHWWRPGETGEVALSQVLRAQPERGEDSRPRMLLALRDGRMIRLPPESVPASRSLLNALALRGVAVAD
ncbi:MAG: hypothetical protein N2Z62_11215 [Rhodobacteraceae bacterium]|nr:hypothetical protein [Paracoccaceae bacterium]